MKKLILVFLVLIMGTILFLFTVQAQQVERLSPEAQLENIAAVINASSAQIRLLNEQVQGLINKLGELHRQIGINQRVKFDIEQKLNTEEVKPE